MTGFIIGAAAVVIGFCIFSIGGWVTASRLIDNGFITEVDLDNYMKGKTGKHYGSNRE